MDASKLEKKVKMLEEERSVMRSDYVIKMESFVGEIDRLKQILAGYENSNFEESKLQQHQMSLADLTNPDIAKA